MRGNHKPILETHVLKNIQNAHFGSTCAKIGTTQGPLAWPLHKDNMKILEADYTFH